MSYDPARVTYTHDIEGEEVTESYSGPEHIAEFIRDHWESQGDGEVTYTEEES